jgi:hypothetical protein
MVESKKAVNVRLGQTVMAFLNNGAFALQRCRGFRNNAHHIQPDGVARAFSVSM